MRSLISARLCSLFYLKLFLYLSYSLISLLCQGVQEFLGWLNAATKSRAGRDVAIQTEVNLKSSRIRLVDSHIDLKTGVATEVGMPLSQGDATALKEHKKTGQTPGFLC